MNCPCGATGYEERKYLGAHIHKAHGLSLPRSLLLAERIFNGETLTPEDLVTIAPPRAGVIPAPSAERRREVEQRELRAAAGVPSDADLDAAIEAAGFTAPVPRNRRDRDAARSKRRDVNPPAPRLDPAPADERDFEDIDDVKDADSREALDHVEHETTSAAQRPPKTPRTEERVTTGKKGCKWCPQAKSGACRRHGGGAPSPAPHGVTEPFALMTPSPTPGAVEIAKAVAIGGIAARIRQLRAEIERGKVAAAELDDIRAALAETE